MQKGILLCIALLFSPLAMATDAPLTLDTAVAPINAEGGLFLVDGIEYTPKGFCPDFQFTDSVVFLTGNPTGECTDAVLLNLRNNATCDVWCQYPL